MQTTKKRLYAEDNMKKNPLVSIIIPVYNGVSLIEETIHSVYKNNYSQYEVILVNDGSHDGSKAICKKLAKRYGKIRFYSFNTNQGLSNILNFAIKKAKGVYIARLNQDDLIMPDRLAQQVKFLESHSDHVAVGGFIELFENNDRFIDIVKFPLTNRNIKNRWLFLSPFSDPAVMFRKKTFKKTKGYQQRFWPVDDVHMWYQLGSLGKLANIPSIVTKVRWHNNAGSIRTHRKQIKMLWKLHLWAAKQIHIPNLFIWLFWVGQYVAGRTFPAKFNWSVFRLIRKVEMKTSVFA